MTYDKLSEAIIGAAIAVHRELGPGLLESIYETCLVHELREAGLAVSQQLAIPIMYKGVRMSNDLRLDLLVDDRIIVEVKAVEDFHPVHQAQLLTYLKLTDKRVGLLLNFNSPVLRNWHQAHDERILERNRIVLIHRILRAFVSLW
jgi:GxxExxY protein